MIYEILLQLLIRLLYYTVIQLTIDLTQENKAKETLHSQQAELETQIKTSQNAIIDEAQMKDFIELLQGRIARDDYDGKRQALEMLGITVWLDGQEVEITGKIDNGIVTIPS